MLNDICMHIAGFVCLRPALHYFYYHWAHHKFTGSVLSSQSDLGFSSTTDPKWVSCAFLCCVVWL